VLEEEMLEVNTTAITPHIVLENSGHVARFTDLLVKDVKTAQGYRADKLLSEWL
jgi:glycyl-tRNA synthetase